MRVGIFKQFFLDLMDGDPVAIIVLLVLLGIIGVICLFWLKASFELRKQDKERKRKLKLSRAEDKRQKPRGMIDV